MPGRLEIPLTNQLDVRVAGRDRTQAVTRPTLVPLRPAPLEDETLREEIELLLDVMASVADCPGHLTSEQVDAALGLPDEEPRVHRIDRRATRKTRKTRKTRSTRKTGKTRVPGAMGDLFLPEPEHWDATGNSCHRHVWGSMLSRLAAERMPPTRKAVERVLADAFRAVVGVDLSPDPLPEAMRQVYWLHVTGNEMSSGVVDVEEWKHRLIPLLLNRVEPTTPGRVSSETASYQQCQHRTERVGARPHTT